MIEGRWSRIAEPPLKNLSYYEQDFYDVTFAPNNDGTPWAHRIILTTESPGGSFILELHFIYKEKNHKSTLLFPVKQLSDHLPKYISVIYWKL